MNKKRTGFWLSTFSAKADTADEAGCRVLGIK